MPVATPSLLTSGNSTTNASTYDTASVSPASNKLILVAVSVQVFSGGTPTLSLSGCSLTWDSIAGLSFSTSSTRLEVFRSLGSSPTTGAITITTTGGGSKSGITWHVIEVGNVPTSGTNGSGAVVQSVNNSTTGNSPNDFSLTLSSLADATNNATLAFFANDLGSASTPSSGYTELADTAASGATGLQTIYAIPGTTTPGTNTTDFADIAGVGIEVAYLAPGPTIDTQPSDATVNMGQTASFSVSATTSGGSLTYQWQSRTVSGSFADIGGATSSSYTTPATNAADHNTYFRCNVTDNNGTVPSNAALLQVIPVAPISWIRA